MTVADMFAWARARDHSFPLLILSFNPLIILPSGERHWTRYLLNASHDDLCRLQARIEQWNARARVRETFAREG